MHLTLVALLAWVVLEHVRLERVDALLEGLALGVCVFASVTLHELGHVLVARRYGIGTRDITLLPIGGVASMERLPEKPREEITVALAGPLVNVAIAAALFAVLVLGQWVIDPRVLQVVGGPFVGKLMLINLSLAAFNLVPAFPMDGGRVLRALLAQRTSRPRATELAARTGQVLAVALGVFGFFFAPTLLFIAVFVWLGAEQERTQVALKAKLEGLTASDAMVAAFQSLDADTPLCEAAERSATGRQHDFPVRSSGQLVGVLSRDALLAALEREGDHAPVSHALQGVAVTVDPATPLARALELMRASESHAVVVLDHGELAGLLTADDVAERLAARAA